MKEPRSGVRLAMVGLTCPPTGLESLHSRTVLAAFDSISWAGPGPDPPEDH